jgi:flavin reductase (DIM6/NTAB) family NADH-FMN oxidoreductase RutF
MNTENMSKAFDSFDIDLLDRPARYKVLTGAVVPRPIAWVCSRSEFGLNLAPFSQFMILAVDPGLLAFSVGPRESAESKDTLVNVTTFPEFVINMAPDDMAAQVQESSGEFPREIDEVKVLGLSLLQSSVIGVPRLDCADVSFECKLHGIHTFADAPNHMVVGRVVQMHVKHGYMSAGKIDPRLHRPLARIGGRNYLRRGEIVSV